MPHGQHGTSQKTQDIEPMAMLLKCYPIVHVVGFDIKPTLVQRVVFGARDQRERI